MHQTIDVIAYKVQLVIDVPFYGVECGIQTVVFQLKLLNVLLY